MTKEEAIEYIKSNPKIYFKPAGKTGYVCPLCQNGTGRDGTGIEENPKSKGHFKCFHCNESGDVLHFIGKEYGLTSFPEILEKAFSIYGIIVEEGKYKRKEWEHKMETVTKKQTADVNVEDEVVDYREFYKEAHANLNKTDYLQKRGISVETQNKFNIGYIEGWVSPKAKREGKNPTPSPRIIIPTSDNSYVTRDTSLNITKNKCMKEGKSRLFNSEALLQEGDEPIFIVEGEIDALSVIEAGGQAVGLGGLRVDAFVRTIEKEGRDARQRTFVICLDNDEAGKDAAKKMEGEFGKAGYAYLNKTEELTDGCKDFNEALVKNKDKAKESILKIIEEAREIKSQQEENYHIEYEERVLDDFDWFYKERNPVPTGIAPLDEFLDGGLYSELYLLAASSSEGKTTLALQIADNIAKEETDVLFFSGEMMRRELVAKSVSRLNKEEWDKDNPNAAGGKNPPCLTSRAIQNLHRYNNKEYADRVEFLRKHYLKRSKHIKIEDGLQEVNAIKTKIEAHKRITGNNPIVFVDYLQILKDDGKEASSKEKRLQIDEIISKLRVMSVNYQTPIFVISILNREAYGRNKNRGEKGEVVMSDLKESGGIEYGADVILTLSADSADENAEEKSVDFRNMKLRIIKSRTGKRHAKDQCIKLKFYPKYNLFEENKEKEGKHSGNDSNGKNEEWNPDKINRKVEGHPL